MPKAPKPASPAESLDILLPDINGIPRGQRIFGAAAKSVLKNGLPWPSSLYAMRFDGHIVEETGLGLRAGDPDFPCRLVPNTFAPTPWRRGGRRPFLKCGAKTAMDSSPTRARFFAASCGGCATTECIRLSLLSWSFFC